VRDGGLRKSRKQKVRPAPGPRSCQARGRAARRSRPAIHPVRPRCRAPAARAAARPSRRRAAAGTGLQRTRARQRRRGCVARPAAKQGRACARRAWVHTPADSGNGYGCMRARAWPRRRGRSSGCGTFHEGLVWEGTRSVPCSMRAPRISASAGAGPAPPPARSAARAGRPLPDAPRPASTVGAGARQGPKARTGACCSASTAKRSHGRPADERPCAAPCARASPGGNPPAALHSRCGGTAAGAPPAASCCRCRRRSCCTLRRRAWPRPGHAAHQ